jgi:hypothetical protein
MKNYRKSRNTRKYRKSRNTRKDRKSRYTRKDRKSRNTRKDRKLIGVYVEGALVPLFLLILLEVIVHGLINYTDTKAFVSLSHRLTCRKILRLHHKRLLYVAERTLLLRGCGQSLIDIRERLVQFVSFLLI